MFKKLKNKIKSKLITWLEIDKLEVEVDWNNKKTNKELKNLQSNVDTNRKYIREGLEILDDKYDSLHRTIQATVSMGADIQMNYARTGSWAVVCFNRGNTPIVKFIDLNINRYDGRDVYEFLKRFDASNYKIDSPRGYFPPDMIFNWHK
jgi:uncharacterized protein YllA (UPF0747 family)